MSSVRMCDRCGSVFSENSEGWSTDSRTVNRVRDDGKRYTVTMQVDQCAPCVGSPAPVAPRIPAEQNAITAAASSAGHAVHADKLAEEIRAAEDADRDATIALLRLQLEDAQDQARPAAGGLFYHGPGCPGHTTGLPAASCLTGSSS